MLTGDQATRLALDASRWRSSRQRRRKGSRYNDALKRLETASDIDRAACCARRLALRDNPRRWGGSALVARWAQRRWRARGPVAWWALRRLAEATDRGDLWALYRLWGVWIDRPDDAAWDALAARPRARVLPEALVLDEAPTLSWPPGTAETGVAPPDDRHEVVETALRVGTNPTRPAAVRAAVGEFCVERGLWPRNRVERALFLVLTGQAQRQRALDPDGSLLSTAYRAADEPTRAAVRQALVDNGAVETVRVIAGAGGGDHEGDVGAEELAHLAGELVGRGDQDALWRLVSRVRLEHALATMLRFGDWRPAAAADRRLFEQLAAAAGRRSTAAGAEHVRRRARTSIDLAHHPLQEMIVVGGAFSPDLSEVVIVRRPGPYHWRWSDSGSLVQVFALPGGGSVDVGSFVKGWRTLSVLHLGDRVAVAEWRIRPQRTSYLRAPSSVARVRTRTGGRWSTLWQEAWRQAPSPLYRLPGGFALPGWDGYGVAASFPAGAAVGGARPLHVPRPDTPPGEPDPVDRRRYLATEPGTGRVAFACRPAGLAIVDRSGTDVATAVGLDLAPARAAFMGPAALHTATPGCYSRWAVEGHTLREVERNRLGQRKRSEDIVTLPGHGVVLGLCSATFYDEDLRLVCLDAESLAERALPPGLNTDHTDVTSLWASPYGECLAVGERERLTVYDLRVLTLAGLLDRPLARMTPADLATVTALRRRSPTDPLVRLLAAALEHRFGDEVGLGRPPGPMPADPDGLGLSGPDQPGPGGSDG